MDAVNEFKGECIFSFVNLCYGTTEKKYFAINDMADTNADEYFICLREEFNDLVSQLETNFNTINYSYADHKEAINELKEMGIVDSKTPEDKPVFTQAMADNGELPQVGMECMAYDVESREFIKVTVLMRHKESIVVDVDGWDSAFVFGNSHEFKPIDTRTDTKKFADDMVTFNKKELTWTHISLAQAIKDNKIHGVKWVGE